MKQFRPLQSFASQKGGQRARSLQLFNAMALHVSGGDLLSLFSAFLSSAQRATLRSQLLAALDSKHLDIVQRIKQLHESERDDKLRSRLLATVSGSFTKPELARVAGWRVGKSAWTAARHPKVPQQQAAPPNPPLAQRTKELVSTFFDENSVPAGNRTCYDKSTKTHVPVHTRSLTLKQLHKKFGEENLTSKISYSAFTKLQPKHIKLAKRKLDMCERFASRQGK